MDSNKSFNQVLRQIGEFLSGLSARQRIMLGGGAVAVVATLFVFVKLIGKPEYKTLYSGMNPSEAQSLGSRLAAKNIEYEISPDGASVSVPAEKLDSSRLEIASQGIPHSGRMGFELFDKPNWGGSDFSEKVNFQRALEGEIERTIQTLSDVEAVRVHLVVPTDSIFTEREREAKAAVILKLRGGKLSDDTHRAISQLVASAVDKLRPENVTVVDAETNRPLNRPNGIGNSNSNADMDRELAERVVKTLEPVVGAQRIRASVHVEYDLSTSEENQETYDPTATVALTMQKSEEHSGGLLPAGVPGTASNVPNANGTSAQSSTRFEEGTQSKMENGTYAVNRLVRHTMQPAGRIKRIAAALLVDDAIEAKDQNRQKQELRRKRTPDEMKQIEELAKATIGVDTTRGDVLAVQNLSFLELPMEKPQPPTVVQQVRTVVNDWSSVLRYVALALLFGVIYWTFLRPIKKQIVAALRELPKKALKTAHADTAASSALEHGILETGATPELKRAGALKKQLIEKVKTEPAAATRLLQTWIREGAE